MQKQFQRKLIAIAITARQAPCLYNLMAAGTNERCSVETTADRVSTQPVVLI
jgi:hypothetical protein